MSYFICACGQGGKPIPIVDEDDNIELFETEQDAERCARNQVLCSHFGYQIFEWES